MKQIPLTRGLFALVDDEDFERVSKHSWCAQSVGRKNGTKRFYASSRINNRLVLLHRFVLGAKPDDKLDHEDGQTLNCQRYNLRLATLQQNAANTRKGTGRKMSSRFKGVCRVSPRVNAKNPWMAYVGSHHGLTKRKYLGFFPTEIEAARAYDAAALKLWGEFSNLNFPL